MSQPEQRERRELEGRAPWECPTLTELGHVKDLVEGMGKLSGNFEPEAGGSMKKPQPMG